MLNINTVKQHIGAGHEFYWEALPFTKRYQLRAVTYTWENGSTRTKGIYVAKDYETAKLICRAVTNLHGTINSASLEKIAEDHYWETGSR